MPPVPDLGDDHVRLGLGAPGDDEGVPERPALFADREPPQALSPTAASSSR
jgi:hypothetical protein